MMFHMTLLTLIAFGCICGNGVSSLYTTCDAFEDGSFVSDKYIIAAWNTEALSKTKMTNTNVADKIAEIISRFDLIVLQDVQDLTEFTSSTLLAKVNEIESGYSLVKSDVVGLSSVRPQQYVMIYKTERITVIVSETYTDPNGHFKYDPFIVIVTATNSSMGTTKFAIITFHADPDRAAEELEQLSEVPEYVLERYPAVSDAIIWGDFSAGCVRLPESTWSDISLMSDANYMWLIDEHADTTTRGTTCPYDRIVINGQNLQSSAHQQSARPFYFDKELAIQDDRTLVYEISSNFPVEFIIRPSTSANLVTDYAPQLSFSVNFQVDSASLTDLKEGIQTTVGETCVYQAHEAADIFIVAMRCSSNEIGRTLLNTLNAAYPCVITDGAMEIVNSKLDNNVMVDPALHGDYVPAGGSTVQLTFLPISSPNFQARVEYITDTNIV